MTILFLSNFFNHHQLPLSDALWQQTGGQYTFVETEQMPPECRALGYPVLERDYVLTLWENEAEVIRRVEQADVVIAGSAPEKLIRRRVRTGKMLLRFSERPLRRGLELHKYLPRLLRWHWRNPPGKPIYLLCASGYAAGDYAKFGLFRGKSWKWGYFPPFIPYDLPRLMDEKNTEQILWCGRLTELKHPEAALRAARRLKQEGIPFTMQLIGSGEQEDMLKKRIIEWKLEDHVRLSGAMAAEEVRKAMQRAGIFLFTSDAREGWGAVLNEAMNGGCAVTASFSAGAVPFLLQHGDNGLCYFREDQEAMVQCLRCLLQNPQEQRRLGMAAYETIASHWNAETAARRLLQLCQNILSGKDAAWVPEGPCSKAEP